MSLQSSLNDSEKNSEYFYTSCQSPVHCFETNASNYANDCNTNWNINEIRVIYGVSYTWTSFNERLSHLLLFTRKKWFELKRFVDGRSILIQTCITAVTIRKEIFQFFTSLKSYVNMLLSNCTPNNYAICEQILREMQTLLLFCGRISSLPEFQITKRSLLDEKNQSATHYFHLLLDVWWILISSINSLDSAGISSSIPLISESSETVFHQAAILLLWDLTTLAARRFLNLTPSEFSRIGPFHCTCVHKLWHLLLELFNEKADSTYGNFWVYWHYITQKLQIEYIDDQVDPNIMTLLSNSFTTFNLIPEGFPIDNIKSAIGFRMWMLFHLTGLWSLPNSNEKKKSHIQNNYSELTKLLKTIFSHQMNSYIPNALHCSLYLTNFWEPQIEISVLFTQFYVQNLNEEFESQFTSKLCAVSKSGLNWSIQIEDWCKREKETSRKFGQETSFTLFLKFLSFQMKQESCAEKKLIAQRLLSGAIFPKITKKVIEDSNENGVVKLFSVLLTVGFCGQFKDISRRFCSFASMVPSSGLKRKCVAWKALFALMHLHQGKNEDFQTIASSAIQQFQSELQNLSNLSSNSEKQERMKLLVVFIECIHDLIDSSLNLTLSEHLLISKEILTFLTYYNGTSEYALVLTIYEKTLSKLKLIANHETNEIFVATQHRVIGEIFEFNVLNMIKEQSLSRHSPPQVATIAAYLTHLHCDQNCKLFKNSKFDLATLFNYFACNSKVNFIVTLDYLLYILKVDKISLSNFHQLECVASWLKCSLTQNGNCQLRFKELTTLVFNLPSASEFPNPEVSSIDESECFDRQLSEIEVLSISFFYKCALKYANSSDYLSKLSFRGSLLKVLNPLVSSIQPFKYIMEPQHNLKAFFRLAGYIVLHLAPILYSKRINENLLSGLIFNTVLSLSIIEEKTIPNLVLAAVAETLPLFLQGLSCVSLERLCYTGRTIKEIVYHYLPKFPLKSPFQSNREINLQHPLLRVKKWYKTAFLESDFETLAIYMIEVCQESFLPKKTLVLPSNFQNALCFSIEIFNQVSLLTKCRIVGGILFPTLQYLLITSADTNSITFLNTVLNYILRACETNGRQEVFACLQEFVNNNLSHHSQTVFKQLENIALKDNRLISDLLPFLVQNVELLEETRGIGLDQGLRRGIGNISKLLN